MIKINLWRKAATQSKIKQVTTAGMKFHRMRRQEGWNETATSCSCLHEPGGIESPFLKILRCWMHEKRPFGRRARKNDLGANLVSSNAFLIFAKCKLQVSQAAHAEWQVPQAPALCFSFQWPRVRRAESSLLLWWPHARTSLVCSPQIPCIFRKRIMEQQKCSRAVWGVSFPSQTLAHQQTSSSPQLCSIALHQGQCSSWGLGSCCNKCALLEQRLK